MLTALAVLAFAAVPTNLLNARVETRVAEGRLAPIVKEAQAAGGKPLWLAYGELGRGTEQRCCYEMRGSRVSCPGCVLEGTRHFTFSTERRDSVPLEARSEIRVLLRVANGRVSDVRVYSADCPLDADGLSVLWLEGVTAAESLALLRSLAPALDDDALSAIAQHADPAADGILVELARDGRTGDMRSQALFWLAQVASRKAVGAIDRAIAEDPETQVKEQAVFALSEMPDGEGVPHLIDLARRHKNPVVREKAFFWLGESEDPRALAFFEEVLKN
jgi:HEAT repeat protein